MKKSNVTSKHAVYLNMPLARCVCGYSSVHWPEWNGKGPYGEWSRMGRRLISWCFKPSQPQRIISGLRETFIKRYIVERTNKTEMRPEEQAENGELSGELME